KNSTQVASAVVTVAARIPAGDGFSSRSATRLSSSIFPPSKRGCVFLPSKRGVRGAAWSHYATRSLLAALKPQLCYSLFHSGRRSDRSIGTRQLQSRAADAKRCGIEKHAEVRHIEDCDVDGTTVIHCNRVNEIAGREKLSCEPAPQLSKIYQDL